jgi:drug/metabolite transporter (DMT)-like permease
MSPPGTRPAFASGPQDTLRGIMFMCSALLCFSLLDATGKWLTPQIGALEVTWIRYTLSVVFVSLVLNPWTVPGLLRTKKPFLQMIRSLLLFGSTLLNFLALRYLPLMEVLSMMFLTPLFVALVSGPLLGEWVGPRRALAILVGFSGVLVVTRPGFAAFHPAIVYSLFAAFANALYAILTRVMASHDPPATTMFYSGVAGTLLLTPFVPLFWVPPPTWLSVVAMVATGFFGALGHWLMILAHRQAPASTLSPFIYTQILYVTVLGFVIFGDLPDGWTVLGSAIVMSSGLYLLHRERVQGLRR